MQMHVHDTRKFKFTQLNFFNKANLFTVQTGFVCVL